MKPYTLTMPTGHLEHGIVVTAGHTLCFGLADNGAPLTYPVDERSLVEGGRLTVAPGDRGALLAIVGLGTANMAYHLRGAYPAERWKAMRAMEALTTDVDRLAEGLRIAHAWPQLPCVGWYELARWTRPIASSSDAVLALYGYVEEGASFELLTMRRGADKRENRALRIVCEGGEIRITDARTETEWNGEAA